MAAGYSRLQVYRPNGIQIAELGASTVRSWTLNDIGRCQFTVNLYDALSGGRNPQATPLILEFGNLLLIEHKPSVNPDGTTNGLLPPWVGIVLPPRTWDYGKVLLTAYSAEKVLQYRCAPIPFSTTGSPGAIFKQLILWANDPAYNPLAPPIQLGQIDTAGPSSSRIVKGSILDEIKSLIQDVGGDWDITPAVDSNNRLTLVANYYARKGVNVGRIFSNVDLEMTSPLFIEQGDFYNWIRGYSAASSTGNRNFGTLINAADIALHGLLGINNVYASISGDVSATGQEAVKTANQQFAVANGKPTATIAPNVLDVGNDYSYLRLGNVWGVQLDTVGFTNGQLGLNGTVRVTAMEYDDLPNVCRIAGVLQ